MLACELSSQQGVAEALLLGERASMTNDDWEQFQRTGVIRVSAISGQHLVVVESLVCLVARGFGFRRRYAAPAIAVFLIGYAVLSGKEPAK
jgi:predicted membrane metal-binding protein